MHANRADDTPATEVDGAGDDCASTTSLASTTDGAPAPSAEDDARKASPPASAVSPFGAPQRQRLAAAVVGASPTSFEAGEGGDCDDGGADDDDGDAALDSVNNEALLAQVTVGSMLEVLWPADAEYHPCVVADRDASGTIHTLRYDDGTVETIDLTWEIFQLRGGRRDETEESTRLLDSPEDEAVREEAGSMPAPSADAPQVESRSPLLLSTIPELSDYGDEGAEGGVDDGAGLLARFPALAEDEEVDDAEAGIAFAESDATPARAVADVVSDEADEAEEADDADTTEVLGKAEGVGYSDSPDMINDKALLAQVAVASRIEVYWPVDGEYHPCTVVGRDSMGAIHTLRYDDGSVERIDMTWENFRLRGDDDGGDADAGDESETGVDVTDAGVEPSVDNEALLPRLSLDSRLEVYWRADGRYHPCVVTERDSAGRIHTLQYDTGLVERIDLTWEIFRLGEDDGRRGKGDVIDAPSPGQEPTDGAEAGSLLEVPAMSPSLRGDGIVARAGQGDVVSAGATIDGACSEVAPSEALLVSSTTATATSVATRKDEGSESESGVQGMTVAGGIHPVAEGEGPRLAPHHSAEVEDTRLRRRRVVTFADNIEVGTGIEEAGAVADQAIVAVESGAEDDSDSLDMIDNEDLLAQVVVGSRLEVYWPVDGEYHPCTVVGRDSMGGIHTLRYDDGSVERIDMTWENFRLRGDDDGGDPAGDETDVTDDDIAESFVDNEALLPRLSLDSRLEVYWRADGRYHPCVVTERDSAGRIHTLQYDDGLVERIDLTWEIFHLREALDRSGETHASEGEVADVRPLSQEPLDADRPPSSPFQRSDGSIEGREIRGDVAREIHLDATGYETVPGLARVSLPRPQTLIPPDAAAAFAATSVAAPGKGESSEEVLVGQNTAAAIAEFALIRSEEEGGASLRRRRMVTFSDDIEGRTTTVETSAVAVESDEVDDSDSPDAINNETLLAQVAVGSRLEVFWPVDGEYHPCTVFGRDSMGAIHTLRYDDGSVERIDMTWENFRLHGDDEGGDADAGDESDAMADVTDDDIAETSIDNEALLPRLALDSRLEVYWRADGRYHPCVVTERDSAGRIHTLQYDDGLVERIDLTWEIFRLGEDDDSAGDILAGEVGSESELGRLIAANAGNMQLGAEGEEPRLTSLHLSEAEDSGPGGDGKPATMAAGTAAASYGREGKAPLPPAPEEKVSVEPGPVSAFSGQGGELEVPGRTNTGDGVEAGAGNDAVNIDEFVETDYDSEPSAPDGNDHEQGDNVSLDEEMGTGDNSGDDNDNVIDATAEPLVPWWQQKTTMVFLDILAIIAVVSVVALLARFLNGEDGKPPGDIEVITSPPSPSQNPNPSSSPIALPITKPTSRSSSLQVKVPLKPLTPTQDMTTELPSISAALTTEPSEAYSPKLSASHYPISFPSSIPTASSSPSKLLIPSQGQVTISSPTSTSSSQESSPSIVSFLEEPI